MDLTGISLGYTDIPAETTERFHFSGDMSSFRWRDLSHISWQYQKLTHITHIYASPSFEKVYVPSNCTICLKIYPTWCFIPRSVSGLYPSCKLINLLIPLTTGIFHLRFVGWATELRNYLHGKTLFLDLITFLLGLDTFTGPCYIFFCRWLPFFWTCTPSCWTSSFPPARPGPFPNHTLSDRFYRFCPAGSLELQPVWQEWQLPWLPCLVGG